MEESQAVTKAGPTVETGKDSVLMEYLLHGSKSDSVVRMIKDQKSDNSVESNGNVKYENDDGIDMDKWRVEWKKFEEDEPVLKKTTDRWIPFLNKEYDPIFSLYEAHEASFWTRHEIPIADDATQWISEMTQPEREWIKKVLQGFMSMDGAVGENIFLHFLEKIQVPEIRAFLYYQGAIENVHNMTYATILRTYIEWEGLGRVDECTRLQSIIEESEPLRVKLEWVASYIADEKLTFYERLLAFMCVEGLFFSSSFTTLFWLKKKGKLRGLTFSNELISRDEGQHVDFYILLLNTLKHTKDIPDSVIYKIVRSAVEIEKKFAEFTLAGVEQPGFTIKMMYSYIEFIADNYISLLARPKIYNSHNPFDWMIGVSIDGKVNFHERRGSDYTKVRRSQRDDLYGSSCSPDGKPASPLGSRTEDGSPVSPPTRADHESIKKKRLFNMSSLQSPSKRQRVTPVMLNQQPTNE